jgi:Spy/CpxP family protein refolding chaperone
MKQSMRSTAILLLCLATTVALAQPMGRMGMRDRMMDRGERIKSQLKLTDAQEKQMAKLRIELQKKQIPIQAKIKTARLEMQELMMADKPDRSAIEKQMKVVSDLQYQAKLNHLDHMLAVRSILTPEQLEIWKKHRGGMRHDFGPPHRGMRERGRMMGDFLSREAEDD